MYNIMRGRYATVSGRGDNAIISCKFAPPIVSQLLNISEPGIKLDFNENVLNIRCWML